MSKKRKILTRLMFLNVLLLCAFSIGGLNSNAAFDTTAPLIGKIKVLNNVIYAPGTVQLELSDIKEDETGIGRISIMLMTPNSTGSWSEMLRGEYLAEKNTPLFTGDTYIISIPVTSTISSGDYQIAIISVDDRRGNTTTYSINENFTDEDENILLEKKIGNSQSTNKCRTYGHVRIYTDEFDADLAISNPNLATQISNMEDGKVARVFVDNTNKTTIPKSVFDALKGTNKKMIVNVSEGVQWVFDGKDITNETKDIDCKVDISAVNGVSYGANKKLMKIDFAPNGILPGEAKIKLKSDYIYKLYNVEQDIALYYLDENQDDITIENQSVSVIIDGSDHWCEFPIIHNSTFLLSQDKLAYHKPVKLNATTLPLQVGKSTTALKIKTKASWDKVKSWKSSKPKVVSVTKKGKLTAKKVGTAYITVTMKSGATAKCKVRVQKGAVKTKKLTVNKKSVTLKNGKTFAIKATKSPLTATDKVTYSTSNKKVATVNGKGKVKAVKKGKATITVKSGKKVVKVKIRVK